MDVVGEHVILLDQCRQPFVQTLQRQAIGRVDAGCAQDADNNTTAPSPGAQLPFGIDPSPGPQIVGGKRPGFINQGTAAIAVNPCRAYVNQSSW